MTETNFSESQLQQSVNTAIIRRIFEIRGEWYSAFVQSLPEEFILGWDTAFYLPWIGHAPLPDHEGCNFFIQYKLSGQLTSQTANEWSNWNCDYYRFTIPHNTKNSAGKYVKDFNQWDRLKALACLGYPTYYATNSFLLRDVLHGFERAGTLPDQIPFLDVRLAPNGHHHVTFTETSTHFFLHSKKEEQEKHSFSIISEQLARMTSMSLDKANYTLISSLKEMNINDGQWKEDLATLSQTRESNLPRRLRNVAQFHQLRAFIHKHIGANMIWYPAAGRAQVT